MGIIQLDGMDHYNDSTEWTRKGWVGSDWLVFGRTGRFGGYALSWEGDNFTRAFSSYLQLTVNTTDDPYFGCAYLGNLEYNRIIEFNESGTAQIGVRINTDGSLSIVRGGLSGTVLGTTAKYYVSGIWHHITFSVHLENSPNGTAKLWVNGELVLDLTGLDTTNTANVYANRLSISGHTSNPSSFYIDDLYIGDDSGSFNTTPPGDRRVYTLYPTGDGTTVDWTANTGTDWDAVNDSGGPDDDTTYISSSTVDQEELFTFDDLPANVATIDAIQIVDYSRKDDAADRATIPIIRSNGANYEEGSDRYLGSTYTFFTQIVEDDPDDSTAWTPAKVNAAEFGIKVAV